ncbi:MAG TPA: hypothetical protein DCY88_07925 [Cyanobacteria bacterium UBA11372]|nr:hypothetical protein [Cyanobacteria bacterium UBA11372]
MKVQTFDVYSGELFVAMEALVSQIHGFEDGWFSAHEANMTRMEAEQIAAFLLHKLAHELDDLKLNEALCNVRYLDGSNNGEQEHASNR